MFERAPVSENCIELDGTLVLSIKHPLRCVEFEYTCT